ncbi:hypothetical protein, partial [Prevotella sp. MGM2]|uniref:hypothetical protein n=1 Tax=Prevotella sp. MGM2 TaxID=2033406 RepID=UPI001CBE7FB0
REKQAAGPLPVPLPLPARNVGGLAPAAKTATNGGRACASREKSITLSGKREIPSLSGRCAGLSKQTTTTTI